jgi:hypothetical protein
MPLSTFLNGENPSQLRGLLWLSLSDAGTLVTSSFTSDSGGGGTVAWSAGTVSIPCRIDPIGGAGNSRLTGGAIDERSTHVVTVPPGTSVDPQNRFAITGRGTFEVTATHVQTGEQARMFEVIQVS